MICFDSLMDYFVMSTKTSYFYSAIIVINLMIICLRMKGK